MNLILKGAVAFGTVAGVGGTSYGIYNSMKATNEEGTTYEEELKGTLLSTTDPSYQSKWQARLHSLQKVNSETDLIQGLRGLKKKTDNNQWKQLRQWCDTNIKSRSKGNQDQKFRNIQSYCTYSIKEQIGTKAIEDGDGADQKWIVAHGKLKSLTNLQEPLKAISNEDVSTAKTKVKDWCLPAYSKPFKGKTDPDFIIASQVCIHP